MSSFPRSFSSLRIVSRTIEYLAWVVEPARIVFLEKPLPLSSMPFPSRLLSVKETRKPVFVGAANSKRDVLTLFVEVYVRFMIGLSVNYVVNVDTMSSKLLVGDMGLVSWNLCHDILAYITLFIRKRFARVVFINPITSYLNILPMGSEYSFFKNHIKSISKDKIRKFCMNNNTKRLNSQIHIS